MSESNSELAREVTLFRFSVLAELLHLPPGSPERAAALQAKARRDYEIPGSRRQRVLFCTFARSIWPH